MALVQQQNQGNRIFVDLMHGEKAGFRRYMGKTTPTDGSDPVSVTETYPAVTGVPVKFSMRDVMSYDTRVQLKKEGKDPASVKLETLSKDQLKTIGALTLRDSASGENVVVNFDVHTSEGGKLIGMLNAARLADSLGADMKLGAFRNENNKTMVYMGVNAEGATNFKPIFMGANGPLINEKAVVNETTGEVVAEAGSYAMLPMGEVVAKIKGKDVWDFSKRDDVISETALVVLDAYQTSKEQDHDSASFSEAAAAAAPKG